MVNPLAGEVAVRVDGCLFVARLSLGALVEIETEIGCSILDVVQRFEAGRFSAREVLVILWAGLRAGGWSGSRDDLNRARIEDGVTGAARVAAELLVRAFCMPGSE